MIEELQEIVLVYTPEQFHIEVQTLVTESGCEYLDAMIKIMENAGIEPEDAAPLVDESLKSKLRNEAEKLSLLTERDENRIEF